MKIIKKVLAGVIAVLFGGYSVAGGLVDEATKKLEQATGKNIATSLVKTKIEAKHDRLLELQREKKLMEEDTAGGAKELSSDIDEVKNLLNELEVSVKKDADNAFLTQKQTILREKYDALLDRQRSREGLLKKINDQILLLEKYLEDPDFKEYKDEIKKHAGPYSFEEFEAMQQQVVNQRKLVEQLKKRKQTVEKEYKQAKQMVVSRLDELQKKQKMQDEFSKKGLSDGTSEAFGPTIQEQAELLELEVRLAQTRKELAEQYLKEKEQELEHINLELFIEKARLEILESVITTVKSAVVSTEAQIEEAVQEVEKKKHVFSELKAHYNNEINAIKKIRVAKEKRLKELAKQAAIPLGNALNQWGWEPKKTFESYMGLCSIGALNAGVLLLQAQEKQFETQIDFEQEKMIYLEVLAEVKKTYFKIISSSFATEDQITQEIKNYVEKKASLESSLKSYIVKKDEVETTLLILQNEVLGRLKDRKKDLKEQKNTVFKEKLREFRACLSYLEEAELSITSRIEVLGAIGKNYSESAAILRKLLAHIDFILGELESITIWYRPGYAISWVGVQKILPDIESFWSDVHAYLSRFNVKRFMYSITGAVYHAKPIALLFKLLFLFLLLIAIRFYFPRIIILLNQAETKKNGSFHVVRLLLKMLLGFTVSYFISIAFWLVIFTFIKICPIADTYLYILFYLCSILYLLYLANRFIRYFVNFNERHTYVFLAQDFQRRFVGVLSILLYATIIIMFFRWAFMLAKYPKTELPTILLAINFIIFQISLIFLISKEQILSVIPTKPNIWDWVRNQVDRYYYLILFFVVAIIVMSNPYVGYGRLVLYLLTSLVYTGLLIKVLMWGHSLFKKVASQLFFSSRDEVVRERFSYAKTWFGVFIIVSFLLFGFLGIILGAKIWGWPLVFADVIRWLQEPFIGRGTTSEVSVFVIMKIGAFILAGFLVAFAFNRFVLAKIFDLMLVETGLQNAITSITRYFLVIVAILLGFQSVQLGGLITYILALILGIGYIIKDPISDLIAYFILLVQRPIKVGDYIQLNSNVMGVVRKITPKSVTIRRKNSVTIVVPNAQVINKPVTNWNYARNFIAFNDILITISYEEDPGQVREILLQVIDAHPNILKNPKPVIRLDDFGEYGYIFMIRGFLSSTFTLEQWDIASDLRIAIVRTLREKRVKVALPVRLMISKTGTHAAENVKPIDTKHE